jgi:hypothetical protein
METKMESYDNGGMDRINDRLTHKGDDDMATSENEEESNSDSEVSSEIDNEAIFRERKKKDKDKNPNFIQTIEMREPIKQDKYLMD